jgi:hypothetical protein
MIPTDCQARQISKSLHTALKSGKKLENFGVAAPLKKIRAPRKKPRRK